jgi:general L-amino acid transport system permease protein
MNTASASVKRPPPSLRVGPVEWLRRNFFATPVDAALTLVGLLLVAWFLPAAIRWAIIDSVTLADTPAACRAAAGACWAVVKNHARIILFGLYPYELQWRPAVALTLVVAATGATAWLGLWRARALAAIWTVTIAVFVVLMGGGVFGLQRVSGDSWGGLPLTVYVFFGTVGIGFPLAVALALGRNSATMPVIRWFCTALIESVRAVPLLTVLFCAAVVVPLLIPGFFNPAKLNRVILSLAVFYACYQAEVIRGGFQGLPKGQFEAARALGLRSWQVMLFIILPQALRLTLPASVNLFVVAFKDTSMVVIVGLFDFVASANTTFSKDGWQPFFREIYILIALVYLLATGVIARLGSTFEKRLFRHG